MYSSYTKGQDFGLTMAKRSEAGKVPPSSVPTNFYTKKVRQLANYALDVGSLLRHCMADKVDLQN